MLVVGLLLAVASPSAVAVPPPAATATRAAATEQDLRALLDLMRPRQAVIDAEIATFEEHGLETFQKQEGNAEIEAEYPGITRKLFDAVRVEFATHAPASEDRLRVRLLTILADNLDPSHVPPLIEFYNSSVGVSIIEQMTSRAAPSAKDFDEMVKSESISTAQINRIRTEAAEGVTLTGRQQEKLLEFMKTPAWASLQRVNGKLAQAQADHFNEPDPEMEKKTEAAITRIMAEYDKSAR